MMHKQLMKHEISRKKNFMANVVMVKLQTFRREFENLNMKCEETIHNYFSRVSILVNKMISYDEDISKRKFVEKILRSSTKI